MNRAALFLLLFAPPALADEPKTSPAPHLTIPPEVTPSGQYARFVPDTDCIGVTYVGLDGLDPVPSDVLNDKRLFLLDTRGLASGRYRFAAVGAEKDGMQLRADFAVVVGTPPGPGPGPNPPNPPTDLTKALQAAYDLDADADKAASLNVLARLYAAMAVLAPSAILQGQPVKTTADAHAWIDGVVQQPGGLSDLTKVKNLRTAIAAEMTKTFGADNATTPIDLKVLGNELLKVSQALQGVK